MTCELAVFRSPHVFTVDWLIWMSLYTVLYVDVEYSEYSKLCGVKCYEGHVVLLKLPICQGPK